MKNAGSTTPIDIDALRIGMYVHLDVGWMSHPFPLSSFRIATQDQIELIRKLGLRQIRWSPEQSALQKAHECDARADGSCAELTQDVEAGAAQVHAALLPAEPAAAESPDAVARRQRRSEVAAERAALALCERQFAEAARECRQAVELVAAQPDVAARRTEQLARALVDKMAGAGDLCIRLLGECAGDRASTHAVNVALVALLMGRTFGLNAADLQDLGVGALLHDVGKLELPARVRHRDEHFTSSESKFYEEHVAHGVAQARRMALSAGATLVIAQHHEHADASGFPQKIGSDRMTTASGIVALVNRYDNLCNPPVPAKALTPHEALSLLFAQGKAKFDTAILSAFIRMMGVYPAGSVVQLTDDRYAIVVSVNSSRPLKPRVAVHDPRVPPDESLIVDLERSPNLGIRRSLRASTLPPEAAETLSPRQRVAYFFEPAPEDATT